MNRLALVTGASGRLGRRLVPLLQERGWRVRALVHSREAPGADESVPGDLTDAASLERALAGADGVVHLAAVTHARSRRAYELVNVGGTRELLAASRHAGVARLVHVSTRAVSSEGGWYAESKGCAEELVRSASLPFCIVRLPELYGAGGREGVDRLIDAVRRHRRVPVVGDGGDELCPVHVDDALGALAAALDSPAALGQTYTLAGECLTVEELVERCAAALGAPHKPMRIPAAVLAPAVLASRVLPLPLYPDQLARLRAPKPAPSPEAGRDLGFHPRPLEEGLR